MREGQLEAAATILAAHMIGINEVNRAERVAEAADLAQALHEKLYDLPDIRSVMIARDHAERDAAYCREQWVAMEKRCEALTKERDSLQAKVTRMTGDLDVFKEELLMKLRGKR